jgi:hypothetical protein
VVLEVTNMDDAVRMAQRLTEKGDTVLLSPACASFDLFENYEDRGNQFKQFTIYKGVSIFLKLNNTNETASKQFKGDKVIWSFVALLALFSFMPVLVQVVIWLI